MQKNDSHLKGGNKIRDCCHKFYHGFDDDNIGVCKIFLKGDERFRVLWESSNGTIGDKIALGFGPISGLSRESIINAIYKSTLSGSKKIEGRQILDKARSALLEAKKLLGYWMEFLQSGSMPSGMNEDDALQHVFNRAWSEQSLENDDDGDDDDDDDEIDKDESDVDIDKQIQSRTCNDDNNAVMSCPDREECDEEDTIKKSGKKDQTGAVAPLHFYPPAMLLFILYGPYGVGIYNLELSAALSMDNDGIDDAARDGSMSSKSIKAVRVK